MLTLKYLLLIAGSALTCGAVALVFYDIYRATQQWRFWSPEPEVPPMPPIRIHWQSAAKLAAAGAVPLLCGLSLVVIPSGMAGVRISQISGTQPGTLYPGAHLIVPLIDWVALYDIRDQIYDTVADDAKKGEVLKVQTKEGLHVGLSLAVRYRLDPKQLALIHANAVESVEKELVPPVVSSAFRQIAPNYMVRELFGGRREEVRRRAADEISAKLAGDSILVKEVMLRDVQLPQEFARGLEGLLLKEQENDRLAFDVEIKQKLVKTAELEAEAERVRRVKEAEGEAQAAVLQAKGESDAMQYTLPLKEKQIEQRRLEAEAAAIAKVTDSKAELERRKLLAEAEAHRIRVTSAADNERMTQEAAALKLNPLLIQKIIAERLSDKVQIMMMPPEGKFIFNDVLRSASATPVEKP